MAKILITGARAPVALELTRNLYRHGHQVIMVDSLDYPLARNSKSVNRFYKISSPRNGISEFKKKLISIIEQEKIEFLIPTCEEVFYISFIKKELEKYCQVMCSSFDLISDFHSKFKIMDMCKNKGVALPSTRIIDKSSFEKLDEIDNLVVKKEFCRFGTDVMLNPTIKKIRQVIDKNDGRVLLQEKISGTEFCTYSIVNKGVVYAEAIYEPSHRIRVAAGIYFKPVINQAISKFIREFCKEYQYTGQIGFDVIVSGDDIYILECNPRATSGMHLLQDADLFQAFIGASQQVDKLSNKASMIGLAMIVIGFPLAIFEKNISQWWSDYLSARDVISNNEDKSFMIYQFLSLTELLMIALKKRISIRQSSTMDIEWDGEKIK